MKHNAPLTRDNAHFESYSFNIDQDENDKVLNSVKELWT